MGRHGRTTISVSDTTSTRSVRRRSGSVNGAEWIDEFDGTNSADAMIGMEETRPIVIPL